MEVYTILLSDDSGTFIYGVYASQHLAELYSRSLIQEFNMKNCERIESEKEIEFTDGNIQIIVTKHKVIEE